MRFVALKIIASLILVAQVSFAQLTVTPSSNTAGNTLQDLVNSLVGDGVVVQNIVCNQTQTSNHYGKFDYVTTPAAPFGPMGIKDGILLCTGQATQASIVGTAAQDVASALLGNGMGDTSSTQGDNYLRRVLQTSGSTSTVINNVVSIEFDVIPSADTIAFKYVFASEEYPNFACSQFNDIFGFFISGPGIVSNQGLPTGVRNIALLPGTTTSVSINSVNGGNPLSANCFPTNVQYFRDNQLATSPTNTLLKFNGYTVDNTNPTKRVLEARAVVIPCQVYRLRLSIANVQDQSFQSGVFIEKGSLRSFGAEVKSGFQFSHRAGLQNAIEGCNAGKLQFTRVQGVSAALEIKTPMVIGGTAVNGVDYYAIDSASNTALLPDSTLPDTITLAPNMFRKTVLLFARKDTISQGLRTVQIDFGSACLQGDTGIRIDIYDYFPFDAGTDREVCYAGEPVSSFQSVDIALAGDVFKWYKINQVGDTISPFPELNCNNCLSPSVNPMDTTTTFVLKVKDAISGCEGLDSVTVFVYNPTISTYAKAELLGDTACDRREFGVYANATTEVGSFTYQWTVPDPLFYRQSPLGLAINPLPEDSVLLVMSEKLPPAQLQRSDWFKVTALTDLAGCVAIDSVLVTIVKQPESRNLDTLICFGTSLPLSQSLMNYRFVDVIGMPKYTWQPAYAVSDTTSPFPVLSPRMNLDAGEGNTRYRLSLSNGACKIPRTIIVAVTDSLASTHTATFTNDTIAITEATFVNLSYDFISPNLSTTRSYGWRLRPESSSIFLLDTTLTNTDSIKVELADPGYYLMTLQSQLRRIYNGETYTCLDSTTNRYFVKPEVIPNIVTPNTTIGANDVFKLPPGKIEIFNRWGKRIFEAETSSHNLDSYWDVAQIPSGTYFYVYQSNRTGDVQKGWVKIIR